MAPDCKSGARKRYAGSNPALPRVPAGEVSQEALQGNDVKVAAV